MSLSAESLPQIRFDITEASRILRMSPEGPGGAAPNWHPLGMRAIVRSLRESAMYSPAGAAPIF
jgi:hypothetical protein